MSHNVLRAAESTELAHYTLVYCYYYHCPQTNIVQYTQIYKYTVRQYVRG